jgi:hypothetical protein
MDTSLNPFRNHLTPPPTWRAGHLALPSLGLRLGTPPAALGGRCLLLNVALLASVIVHRPDPRP